MNIIYKCVFIYKEKMIFSNCALIWGLPSSFHETMAHIRGYHLVKIGYIGSLFLDISVIAKFSNLNLFFVLILNIEERS